MTDVKSSDASYTMNPLAIWVRSGRLWSLPASVMPVWVALVMAWKDVSLLRASGHDARFLFLPAICCFMFAVLAHISANLLNDYSDYRTGANADVRAKRESGQRVSEKSLFIGGVAAFCTAAVFGLATIPYGGMTIVLAGVVTGAICLMYSVGPFPLSEWGLGDVADVLTFGLSSVVFTHFLQLGSFSVDTLLLGFAFGMAINNLLVANNFGDYEDDKAVNKYTTIVLFGKNFGRLLYIAEGFLGAASLAVLYTHRGCWGVFAVLSVVLYLASHLRASMTFLREDFVRPTAIGQSARNVTLLGVLVPLALLF